MCFKKLLCKPKTAKILDVSRDFGLKRGVIDGGIAVDEVRANYIITRNGATGGRISGFASGNDGRDGADTEKQGIDIKTKRRRKH